MNWYREYLGTWKDEHMAKITKRKTIEPTLIEDTGKVQYLIVPKGCVFPYTGMARYRDGQDPGQGNQNNTWNYYGWRDEEQAVANLKNPMNHSGIATEDFFAATTEAVFPRSNELGEICP